MGDAVAADGAVGWWLPCAGVGAATGSGCRAPAPSTEDAAVLAAGLAELASQLGARDDADTQPGRYAAGPRVQLVGVMPSARRGFTGTLLATLAAICACTERSCGLAPFRGQ